MVEKFPRLQEVATGMKLTKILITFACRHDHATAQYFRVQGTLQAAQILFCKIV